MQVTLDDNPNFWPQGPGRWTSPLVLALLAHLLLMAALTWGVHWRKEQTAVAFEAEIWSSVPREAAPRAVAPPPEPEPEPEPQPRPEPQPVTPPKPPEPVVKPPEINTEQLKKKKEEEQRKQREAEQKEKKALQAKLDREKKAKEDAEKKRKADEDRKLAQKKREAQEMADAAQREKDRKDAMARLMGQIGASGGPTARGSAQQSSGPTPGYGARVAARIRPNIRYSEEFPRSLRTEIEVRAMPDGTITARRVTQSSGNPNWDEAALKAIDRTGTLPRDTDGRVPSPIIIIVKPID